MTKKQLKTNLVNRESYRNAWDQVYFQEMDRLTFKAGLRKMSHQ